MPWPELLVLVRHAESEGNVLSVEERVKFEKGSQLYELTARGHAQARITGEHVRERFGPFDIKYTSYYPRAKQTMQHLLQQGERWYEDPRLAEAQRGIWHTLSHEEIDRFHPGERIRKEREGLYHYRAPGGENWPDVELRIHSFLGTLARDGDGKKVLIVVHGHWLILFERLIHHFTIEEAMDRYQGRVAENASVHIYEGGKRLTLREGNIVPWMDKV